MKHCFKCGACKPVEEFYRHPMMADGRLGKCKECCKLDVRRNYASRHAQYLAYERSEKRRASRQRRALPNLHRHRSKYPAKNAARQIVCRALRAGTKEDLN